MAELSVPEPLSSDTSDVTDALDVAQSLWENGKRVDAIHWVKRAAESARSADPMRMAALARAADDLERAMAPRSVPPPATTASKPPPVPSMSRPPPPPVPKMSKPPPVPPPRTTPSVPPPMQFAPPAPPVQAAQSVPPMNPTLPPPPRNVQRAPVPQLLQQPASEDRMRLAPSPSTDQTLRVRATVRVSVKTSVRDSSLLVVRPLADGVAVPAGTREALLTFVADDTDDAEASS